MQQLVAMFLLLFSLSEWPPGLIFDFPRPGDRYPESVVVVSRAS
jgi:hypothetical protein